MAADFNPLDTSQRNKVLQVIQQLADAGLSDDDIMKYFGQAESLGRSSLSNYLSTAGTAISRQFQPQIDQTRDLLGANPLLADSGYANRASRQLMTDLAERTSQDYNRHAAGLSEQNLGFYRDLVGQRAGLRSGLAGNAYQTFLGLPRKKKFGEQALGVLGQAGGAVLGGLVGGPAGAAVGSGLLGGNYHDPQSYARFVTSPENIAYEQGIASTYKPRFRPYGDR